jgi:type IV pilus assembly protein PilV
MQNMKTPYSHQRGSMLLEALIAILIFSLGILAIVGLQAGAVKLSSDAKYRTDANLFANQIIGQMWVSDRTATTLQSVFQGSGGTGGAAYTAWANDVALSLPGVSGVSGNKPVVSVVTDNNTNPPSSLVTVTVTWQMPGNPTKHKAVVIAQII